MAHWVTIWRAAHLVGVPRGVLQQQVRAGDLALVDGLVSTDALLALYPQAEFESSGMFERAVQIRDESFGRRVRERLLPSQEVLAQRLFRQSQELADAQRHLQRYHALVVAVRTQARELRAAASKPDAAAPLDALLAALDRGLARALATEPVNPLDAMDDMLKVMSAQVTVRPSGRQFVVEGHDTLLQAGMKAGLNLPYGCGNGSCGMCKVRVVHGEVVRTQHTDYALSEVERAQGHVLACAHTAGSAELSIETLEAAGPDEIPEQQITASVRAVKPLSADVMLVHLQTPRTHRLRFLAGQRATLGFAGSDDVHAELGIASCPCDDRNLHFFVARDATNGFARALFEGRIRAGDAVTVWGPRGRFVLGDETRPLVFIACDTGFAPVKSLIEHALSLDAAPSIALYWLATSAGGHFLENQCRAWSAALDTFEHTLIEDADAAQGASLIVSALRRDVFDIDAVVHVAGPERFVETVCAELLTAGMPPSQLRSEVLS